MSRGPKMGESNFAFNRTRERDFVPCVREWEEPDGRHVTQVVRTSSSGACARSIVIRRRDEIVARHHHVTQPGANEGAAAIWRSLASQASVTLPKGGTKDPSMHIALSAVSVRPLRNN